MRPTASTTKPFPPFLNSSHHTALPTHPPTHPPTHHTAGKAPAPKEPEAGSRCVKGKAAEDAKEFGEILEELRETIEATKEEIKAEAEAPGSLSAK